jgi:hypothetical protein
VDEEEYECALKRVLADADLPSVAELADELPAFMRPPFSDARLRESVDEELDFNQFELWTNRCRAWAAQHRRLKELALDAGTTELKLEDALLTEALLAAICRACPKLHSLTLLKCEMDDTALASLVQALKERLTALDLRATTGFSDLGAKSIAVYATKLQRLLLSGCDVSDASLGPVCKYCTELEELELNTAARVSDATLRQLPSACAVRRVEPPPRAPKANTRRSSSSGAKGVKIVVAAETAEHHHAPLARVDSMWGRMSARFGPHGEGGHSSKCARPRPPCTRGRTHPRSSSPCRCLGLVIHPAPDAHATPLSCQCCWSPLFLALRLVRLDRRRQVWWLVEECSQVRCPRVGSLPCACCSRRS